jgi:hypothetical protein
MLLLMLLQELADDTIAPVAVAAAPAAAARTSMFDLDDGGDVDLGEWRCFVAV